jgi:amidase
MVSQSTEALQRILRDQAMSFLVGHDQPPILTVQPAESFVIETEDALAGRIRSADRLPISEHVPELLASPPELNPCAGPIYVEGARRGDVLAVRIEKIEVDEQGVTCFVPGVGPLSDSYRWQECHGPFTHIIRHEAGPSGTTRDGRATLNERMSWDLRPFIGTIGTSPDRETEATLVGQGAWGGNMDCRDICEGSILYLNCYHDGGLLFVGDAHGSQADTEFYGIADETRAEVTLSCEIIQDKRLPSPRIEKPESIVCLYSYRPLDDAVRTAMMHLFEMMVLDYGVPPKEAYMHLCINPEVRVNVYQMIPVHRIQYTVGAEMPKRHLQMYG